MVKEKLPCLLPKISRRTGERRKSPGFYSEFHTHNAPSSDSRALVCMRALHFRVLGTFWGNVATFVCSFETPPECGRCCVFHKSSSSTSFLQLLAHAQLWMLFWPYSTRVLTGCLCHPRCVCMFITRTVISAAMACPVCQIAALNSLSSSSPQRDILESMYCGLASSSVLTAPWHCCVLFKVYGRYIPVRLFQ